MIFASNIFLFAFLPLFLSLCYLTPLQYRSLPILIGSYLFYAWWRVDFTFLFAGVTIWNYLIFKLMTRGDKSVLWMRVGIIGNLLTLGFFKYVNFGIDSFNAALTAMGAEPIALASIILPIGISFYIFQAISFLVDINRKDAPHPKNFVDFAAYISLFPQLIAGPIVRYKDIAAQFQNRIHTLDKFSEGAYRFMIGFAQKVLIADSLAPLADQAFNVTNPTFIESWLGALAFSGQLYFDFLGYSSMAIGLGLMMGFRFMENFNHPYLSRSITEFWRRWHISLSSWLKDYLYIPLGGNRLGAKRTYANLMLTMVLGGLWHGTNWTFALWGAWHGLWLAIERAYGVKDKAAGRLMILPTLLIVILGWVIFKADNLPHALHFYQGMMGMNGFAVSDVLSWQITRQSLFFLGVTWVIIFLHPKYFDFRLKTKDEGIMTTTGYKIPLVSGVTIILFMLSIMKLAADSYSPFLYFQF